MTSATEVDREPECFFCRHFRKPAPTYQGWCRKNKHETGDIDTCLTDFEEDLDIRKHFESDEGVERKDP